MEYEVARICLYHLVLYCGLAEEIQTQVPSQRWRTVFFLYLSKISALQTRLNVHIGVILIWWIHCNHFRPQLRRFFGVLEPKGFTDEKKILLQTHQRVYEHRGVIEHIEYLMSPHLFQNSAAQIWSFSECKRLFRKNMAKCRKCIYMSTVSALFLSIAILPILNSLPHTTSSPAKKRCPRQIGASPSPPSRSPCLGPLPNPCARFAAYPKQQDRNAVMPPRRKIMPQQALSPRFVRMQPELPPSAWRSLEVLEAQTRKDTSTMIVS